MFVSSLDRTSRYDLDPREVLNPSHPCLLVLIRLERIGRPPSFPFSCSLYDFGSDSKS